MKKIYNAPVTEIIKVETQQIIAASPSAGMYATDATSAGMSRGGGLWDDEDDEEDEDW